MFVYFLLTFYNLHNNKRAVTLVLVATRLRRVLESVITQSKCNFILYLFLILLATQNDRLY